MIGNSIDIAAAYLRAGQVIGMPTETVYGLAGNATDEDSIHRIYSVKDRPYFDPLIVHVSHIDEIFKYTLDFSEKLLALGRAFMPGPLTLLLPKNSMIPDLITAGSSHVAIRVPKHAMAQELLCALDFPLAAPSANPFGYISPTSAQHVADQLSERIPYILDGGPCQVGVESTIVGEVEGRLCIYRKGGVPVEDILPYDPSLIVVEQSSSNPSAPGMLKSHYASEHPLHLQDQLDLRGFDTRRTGLLSLDIISKDIPTSHQIALDINGNLNMAGSQLFSAMRRLDQMDIDHIIAITVPEVGIGRAINDRLRRAAAEK